VLAVFIATWVMVMGFLAYRNQSNFNTFGFDIGIHDQAIWLAAHGKSTFDTVRGLGYFAENVNLISMVFVPFYWLGAGPHFLIVAHTVALGFGAWPLWLIGRRRFDSPWLALCPAVVYLLYPVLGYLAWWGYHPDSLAILPLLFAWWFAIRGRWVGYGVCVVVAMSCKEDAALAVIGMGIGVAIWCGLRRISPDPQRAAVGVGLVSSALGVAWFEICTRIILPDNNFGLPPFYSTYFPALGTTPTAVIRTALRHPSRVWHLANLPDRRSYYWRIFAPVAFLVVAALPALLVALPQLGINIVDQGEDGATITSQYSSLVVVGVMLATVEALGVIRRRYPRLLVVATAAVLATTVASTIAWGITPLGRQWHTWWPDRNPQSAQITHALALVPASAGVSVTYNLTPHVTHRVFAFEYPNPWINVNWLSTKVKENPAEVQWIVVEEDLLDPAQQSLLTRLTAARGPFVVVYQQNGVVAARRRTG
jgi:uncharacterized membrane protein